MFFIQAVMSGVSSNPAGKSDLLLSVQTGWEIQIREVIPQQGCLPRLSPRRMEMAGI